METGIPRPRHARPALRARALAARAAGGTRAGHHLLSWLAPGLALGLGIAAPIRGARAQDDEVRVRPSGGIRKYVEPRGDTPRPPSSRGVGFEESSDSGAGRAGGSRSGEPGGTRRIGSAAADLPGSGIYGLDTGEPLPPDESVKPSTAGPPPEFHVVKTGDTLWSMCQQYFSDPWRWPRLWAQNPLITNPHWIFPGDVIRLRGPEAAPAAAVAGAGAAGAGAEGAGTAAGAIGRAGSITSTSIMLRETAYLETKEFKNSAVITGSREEKIMLAAGDQAYLKFPGDRPLKAGERYSVYVADIDHPVRSPDTGDVIGYIVRIHSDIVIDQIADKSTARGTLVDVIDPVERGYLVTPLVRQFKRVEPRPSAVSLEARIIASFTPVRLLGAGLFVVISRGQKDGIEVGNRSFVIRRGDGYRPLLDSWDSYDVNYPKEVVGELVVIDVREATSVAWISRTNREVRVGERIEMRKGH